MSGNLTLNGLLDLNGQVVTVTGTFISPCGPCTGRLRSTIESGVLRVRVDAVFDGASTAGLLTAGTLEVERNFVVSLWDWSTPVGDWLEGLRSQLARESGAEVPRPSYVDPEPPKELQLYAEPKQPSVLQ